MLKAAHACKGTTLAVTTPIGGGTLPILDRVFADGQQNTPQAERLFLQRLHAILPPGAPPMLITDAGFRAPWFRAVQALGWYWVGWLRHRTLVKPASLPDTAEQWISCKALYELAGTTPRDLGLMDTVRNHVTCCRCLIAARPAPHLPVFWCGVATVFDGRFPRLTQSRRPSSDISATALAPIHHDSFVDSARVRKIKDFGEEGHEQDVAVRRCAATQ